MNIQDLDGNELLYRLNRQHPTGVTTYSPCRNKQCSRSSRGGDFCSGCLNSELVRRGANVLDVQRLTMCFDERSDISSRIDIYAERIIGQIEGET